MHNMISKKSMLRLEIFLGKKKKIAIEKNKQKDFLQHLPFISRVLVHESGSCMH